MRENQTVPNIEEIIECYGDVIYRLALHYLKRRADAEDVVQEVLLSFLTHRGSIRNPKAWLIRVTVNKSLNVIKSRREGLQLEESQIPISEKSSLADELSMLAPLEREIVYLFYFEGYSSKEIAGMLRKSDASVRKRLERAKKQLKHFLEVENET